MIKHRKRLQKCCICIVNLYYHVQWVSVNGKYNDILRMSGVMLKPLKLSIVYLDLILYVEMYTFSVLTNYAFKYYDYHSRHNSYWTVSLHVLLFISFYPVQLSNQIQHLQGNLNQFDFFNVLYKMNIIKYHNVNSFTI